MALHRLTAVSGGACIRVLVFSHWRNPGHWRWRHARNQRRQLILHVRLLVRMLGMLGLLMLLLLVWIWRRLALIRIAAAVLLIGIHVGAAGVAASAVCALRCGVVLDAVGGVLGLSGRGMVLEVRLHGGASKRQAGRASRRVESNRSARRPWDTARCRADGEAGRQVGVRLCVRKVQVGIAAQEERAREGRKMNMSVFDFARNQVLGPTTWALVNANSSNPR